jgi:hypothetical protein
VIPQFGKDPKIASNLYVIFNEKVHFGKQSKKKTPRSRRMENYKNLRLKPNKLDLRFYGYFPYFIV